jgi:DNA-directed RNA polymerase subunit M/transcription elongation factor TFIIS
MSGYCPKCGSRLYPDDEKAMRLIGVCSGCVCYDRSPDRRYQTAYDAAVKKEAEQAKKRGGRDGRKAY